MTEITIIPNRVKFRIGTCCISAIADAYNRSYAETLSIFSQFRKNPEKGCSTEDVIRAAKLLGGTVKITKPNISVALFVEANIKGSYMIICKEHTFFYCDGIIIDTFLFLRPFYLTSATAETVIEIKPLYRDNPLRTALQLRVHLSFGKIVLLKPTPLYRKILTLVYDRGVNKLDVKGRSLRLQKIFNEIDQRRPYLQQGRALSSM